MVYILPSDFLLKDCVGEPADNKISTIITTQKSIISNCNAEKKLLRDWKAEKIKEQEENDGK